MKNKIFDWDAFCNEDNYIVVYCKSEKEAKDFCIKMHEHGLKWRSGLAYSEKTLFPCEKTYYDNHGLCSNDKKDYLEDEFEMYTFYEWSDYMEGEYIEISKKELITLLADHFQLTELEWGGVDNWEWYGENRHEYMRDRFGKEFLKKLYNKLNNDKVSIDDNEIYDLSYEEIAEEYINEKI